MTPVPPSTLLNQLHWRYATKRFDPNRKIPADLWKTLEEVLVLAPSSFGLQPWKFVVVTNPETKRALVLHSWTQSQPGDCSHHVVFAVRKGLGAHDVERYVQRIMAVRGATRESLTPYQNIMLGSLDHAAKAGHLDAWQTHQVYIALGQFMASAAMLGVDTCPMEGIDPARYDEDLGLTGSGYATVVACAAGYRAADDKYATVPKVRFPITETIRHV